MQDVVLWVRPMGDAADGGIASLNWLTKNHIADPGTACERYDRETARRMRWIVSVPSVTGTQVRRAVRVA